MVMEGMRHKLYSRTIIIMLSIMAGTILIMNFVVPTFRVYGRSMNPNLVEGEVVITMRMDEYKSGDIVAFYYEDRILIKRIVAKEADRVHIDEDGLVYINTKLLDEPYVEEKVLEPCDMEFPCIVPKRHYFLLGDNRSISADSRSSDIGFIPEEHIVGKVIFKIWPLKNIGPLGE